MLPEPRSPAVALLLLSVFFVAAGANHFVSPDFYVRMMPPRLPAPLGLVYLSGLFEIVGGILVLLPRARAMAGWGLILLLVAVFPANVHMAVHPELFPELAPAALWARLPLQGLIVAWAYWATRPQKAESHGRQ